jgi:hypothetical protein
VLQKWNTRADGTGRDYVDGDRFNPADAVDGTVTLYAQWIFDGFYIAVSAPDASPSTVNDEIRMDDIGNYGLTYDPYDVSGFVPPANKAASAFKFGELETEFDYVTFHRYAYYMVSNGDGTYPYGPYNSPSDPTYLKVDGEEVYYSAGPFSVSVYAYEGSTVPLTLVWTTNITAVTFHPNGATGDNVVINYPVFDYDIEGLFPSADLFTREGYTFIGWGPDSDSESQDCVGAGVEYLHQMGNEFWAIWDMSMTVTYNANGGTGTIADQNILLSSRNYLSSGNGLSRDGYVLVGWATSADSTTLAYQKGAEFAMEIKASMSRVSSRMPASLLRLSLRATTSSGRIRPRCLLSRLMSLSLGT